MRHLSIIFCVLCPLMLPTTGKVAAQNLPVINEIRIDQPGGDVDEYFELAGPPGFLLDGLTYVVIGDGPGASGVIEAAIPIFGAIGGSGYFVVAESSFTLGVPDQVSTLNFENNDNVTHLLVADFTGGVGQDLDGNDDCILDIQPWGQVLDLIALIEEDNPPVATECHYGPPTVGPISMVIVPGHVIRCPDGTGPFIPSGFDPAGGSDTPGAANACPAPPVPAFGFLHTALGQAQLQATNDTLVVSNIGASGDDGVEIANGSPDCSGVLTAVELPPNVPPGSSLAHSAVGAADGNSNSALWTITVLNPGQFFVLMMDYFAGASTTTVELTLNGSTVFVQSGLSGPLAEFLIPSRYVLREGKLADGDLGIEWHFPDGPTPVTIPGGPTITADAVVLTPDGPTIDVEGVHLRRLTSSGFGPVTIYDEAISMFPPDHLLNRALGDAHFEPNGGILSVTNIGSSGEDGVSTAADGDGSSSTTVPLIYYRVYSTTPSSSAVVDITAHGTLAGQQNPEPVSSLQVAHLTNNVVQLTPDFSPVGSSAYFLRLYDGNELVAVLDPATGPMTLESAPDFDYTVGVGAAPWGAQINFLRCDGPTTVTTATGDAFVADRFVFDPDDATNEIDALTRGTVTSNGDFDIGDQWLQPALPQVVPAFGRLHSGLGDAALDPSNGQLTISNIGSSGEDGVLIDIGEADTNSFLAAVQLPPSVPAGASIDHLWSGSLNGGPEQALIRLIADSLQLPNPTLQLLPDFLPIGSSTYTIKLLLDGSVVFEQSGLSGPAAQLPPPAVYTTLVAPGGAAGGIVIEYIILPSVVTIPGGPSLLADTIVLCPDNSTYTTGGIFEIIVTVDDGFGDTSVIDEAVGLFAPGLFHHRATGSGRIQPLGDRLIVSNIGSSGEDGVAIDLGGTTEGFQAAIAIPPDAVVPGATWTAEAVGEIAGAPTPETYCMLWAEVLPQDQIMAAPDFSPIGSSTFTGRLYLQGDLVALWQGGTDGVIFPLQPGYVAGVAPTPDGAQTWLTFDQPIPVTLPSPGPGTFTADTIVFDAENATELVFNTVTVVEASSGLGSFEIEGESLAAPIPPQTCDSVVQLSCSFDSASQSVQLSWINADSYDGIAIDRGGMIIAMLPGTATAYVDASPPPGTFVYRVVPICDNGMMADAVGCVITVPGGTSFVRGDCDGDGAVNFLVDSLYLLTFGFLGGPPPICNEATDIDGDGAMVPLVDALYGLTAGFLGGPPPPAPYPACGADPAPATSLGCAPNGCP